MQSHYSRPDFGALVISLDFELHWGVRDRCAAGGSYRANLLGARLAIPRILDLFEEFEVAATWAVVGFLFAESRSQREFFSPMIRPRYIDLRFDPYQEPTGESESDDPLHYAPELIRQIDARPMQEIATHTFSHYYCLEAGETPEAFAADLHSAVAIARHRGISLRSIVFPRNQFRAGYEAPLKHCGIVCYRGNECNWMHAPRPRNRETLTLRAPRLLDSYVPLSGSNITPWDEIPQSSGLYNVRQSMFLRPYSPATKSLQPLLLRRIASSLHAAAEQRAIFHLWWHPHNFGAHTDENLQSLRKILCTFRELRRTRGMRSLTMSGVADALRRSRAPFEAFTQIPAAAPPAEQTL